MTLRRNGTIGVMIELLLILESAETRGWMLLAGSASAMIISVMTAAAWGRSQQRALLPICLVFVGWSIGSVYFSWWNFIGRIEMPHHLMIPNLSSALMIVGGWWFVWSLFFGGRAKKGDG